MNWNFISVVAETVASVTVIISLIYLAIQVRLQAKEYRMMVTNSLTQQWGEALQTFAVHEDLYKIWMAGLQDFHALNAVERGRFSSILRSTPKRQVSVTSKRPFSSMVRAVGDVTPVLL